MLLAPGLEAGLLFSLPGFDFEKMLLVLAEDLEHDYRQEQREEQDPEIVPAETCEQVKRHSLLPPAMRAGSGVKCQPKLTPNGIHEAPTQ